MSKGFWYKIVAGVKQLLTPLPSAPPPLKIVVLRRTHASIAGTFGTLEMPSGQVFASAEPPWLGNAVGDSCIPPGFDEGSIRYVCRLVQSPKFGRTYMVTNVPGRSHILFHAGNWAGHEGQGLKTDTDGCILLGVGTGALEGQKALLYSRRAMRAFFEELDWEPFALHIQWAPEALDF